MKISSVNNGSTALLSLSGHSDIAIGLEESTDTVTVHRGDQIVKVHCGPDGIRVEWLRGKPGK